MATRPTVLEGERVRLVPLRLEHAPELLEAAETPETFRYFTGPPDPWTVEGMERYIWRLITNDTIAAHAVVDRTTGTIVGSTTYCDIRPAHRGLEIGWTWYAPAARGTPINPEAKLLLLTRAFETPIFPGGPAIRVQLKTDERNAHSRAAILKLGASFEGVLREHVIMPDGHHRASALYSITTGEWAGVKAGLEARVAAHKEPAHGEVRPAPRAPVP